MYLSRRVFSCFSVGLSLMIGGASAPVFALDMTNIPSHVAGVRFDLSFKVLAEISKNEVTEGHLFHAGLLWEGAASESGGAPYFLSVYGNGGTTKLTAITLPHSVMSINAYGPNSVVVIGRSTLPTWRTHYSVVTKTGTEFKVKTVNLPEEYMVSDFVGNSSKMFFSEVGEASVLSLNPVTGSVRPLPMRISGPGHLELDGNSLFAIENRNMNWGDENILKINLLDNTFTRTFPTSVRNGLANIKIMKGTNYLAATEMLADKVLLINKTTNELAHEISLFGKARGISQLGHCLVVATEETQGVAFIDLNDAEPKVIDHWDLSAADSRFKKARGISVDEATGQIFLRSTYFCGSCSVTQSSVVRVEQMDGVEGSVIKTCMAN